VTGREVLQLIETTRRLWPTVPWHVPDTQVAQLVDEWTAVYDGFTLAEVADRLVWAVRNGHQFPPGPSTLVQMCLAERDRRNGITAPDADEAWQEVVQAVSQRGWYAGPPDWSHPAIADAARTLGWNALCHADNQTVLHGQFTRAYTTAVARHTDERRRSELTALAAPHTAALTEGGASC